jgi:gamma-glutamyltranspeptidase/glutathione hydrolase
MVPSFGSLSGDTVYVAAVDRDGNAASLIQSLYGASAPAWWRETPASSCKTAAPISRSIATTPIASSRQDPAAYADRLDGQTRRQALERARLHGRGRPAAIQLQLYSAMIDFGLDIQEAIEMPRFLSGRFALGEARDTLHIEGRFPEATIDALARRGHASIVGTPGTKWPVTRTASRSIRGTAC